MKLVFIDNEKQAFVSFIDIKDLNIKVSKNKSDTRLVLNSIKSYSLQYAVTIILLLFILEAHIAIFNITFNGTIYTQFKKR